MTKPKHLKKIKQAVKFDSEAERWAKMFMIWCGKCYTSNEQNLKIYIKSLEKVVDPPRCDLNEIMQMVEAAKKEKRAP